MIFFISRKRYLIGEVLKRIFFWNPGIVRLVAVEWDVKPRNMNFAKVEKMGEGRLIGGGGGGVIWINTVVSFQPWYIYCVCVHANLSYFQGKDQCVCD